MIRRRRPSSPSPSPSPAPALEDDDLLEEILLRLPPQPSSLPRASAVCARWRRALSDPRFHRRFREHHRKPPLLGFFAGLTWADTVFTPILDAPDRMPASRLPMPRPPCFEEEGRFAGCRNGFAVLLDLSRKELVVWHPLTDHQRRVPYPAWFKGFRFLPDHHASVLCTAAAAAEDDERPFRLAFVCTWDYPAGQETFACLYDSMTGAWGNRASTPTADELSDSTAVLVGNTLCWSFDGGDILEFDFERHSLTMTKEPADAHVGVHVRPWERQVLRTEDGGLGIADVSKSELSIQLWQRKRDCNGVVGWVRQKSIQLSELFPLSMRTDPHWRREMKIAGYDEDSNAIVLATCTGNFMLRLDNVQCIKISESDGYQLDSFHPYSSFYTTGRGVHRGV